MARRRRQRDVDTPSLELDALLSPQPVRLDLTVSRSVLPEIEDRRLYDPLKPFAPARSIVRSADADVVARPRTQGKGPGLFVADKFQFREPQNVAICVRRKSRREVLFAQRKTGRGAKSWKRRRNYYSSVACK